MASQVERELRIIKNNLKKLGKEFDKKGQQKILRSGALVIKKAVKAASPKSKKTHFRYNSAKLDKSKRAAKGSGQVEASYEPGNFERSISTMTFRKSSAVFVGPKIAKGNKNGHFSGNRVDGYYAHMVEIGTVNYSGKHPIRTGYEASKGLSIKAIENKGKKVVRKFTKKL